MARLLGRPEGGFIPRWYSDPVGAGHRPEAIEAMCEEFLKISDEMYSAAGVTSLGARASCPHQLRFQTVLFLVPNYRSLTNP